jgi:hypothetical protein
LCHCVDFPFLFAKLIAASLKLRLRVLGLAKSWVWSVLFGNQLSVYEELNGTGDSLCCV